MTIAPLLGTRGRSRAVATLGYRLLSSPKAVAATVCGVYGAWIAVILGMHGSPFAFVNPGRRYVDLAGQHGLSLPSLPAHYGGTSANSNLYGYDGQFTYFLALHPGQAKYLLDVPWYRYQRILAPLLIKILSLGNSALVPWLMLAVSWIAVVAGTWAIASWLSTRGRSPGWALVYGFFPGLIVSVRNDLTDGLAYGLVAVAILLVDRPGRSRPALAAVIVGLAVFARQEVAIYAVMIALGIAAGVFPQPGADGLPPVRYRLARALKFVAIALGPFGIYLIFLSHWVKGVPNSIFSPPVVPGPEMAGDILFLIIPAVICCFAFRPTNLRFKLDSRDGWAWSTYSIHILALTGFMIVGRVGVYYSWSFSTVFRYYIPAALGALLCYGCMQRPARTRSATLLGCGVLVMVGLPILVATGL